MKEKTRHIYIIGIAGKGLNGIAQFCLEKGYYVSGSDIRECPELEALRDKGAAITTDQDGEGVRPDIDTVVYSSIIRADHPEIVAAKCLGIRTQSRAEFLGELTRAFFRISVAGSHGKSTTSALAALAIEAQTGAVNAITGSHIKEFGSYQKAGASPYCVLEACEYAKSFLHIPGKISLITSLEKSHMEFFGSEEAMNDAFREFIAGHARDSVLIINGDSIGLRNICSGHPGQVVTCGFNASCDYVIRDVRLGTDASFFSLYRGQECLERDVALGVPGTYNMLNAALVLVMLRMLGHGTDKFRGVLGRFRGVGRRFEITRFEQAVFVDDFAHHPTQVENLLKGLRQFFPARKIVAVFEPRQYHLMRTFLREYGKSFSAADEVCVTDIVPALGDTLRDMESLSTKDIIESVSRFSTTKKVWHGATYDEIAQKLRLKDLSQFVVATIGAGNVFRVRDLITNKVQ